MILAVVAGGLSLARSADTPDGRSPVGRKILEIKVAGNQRVDAREILACVGSRVGQPFDREQVQQDQASIFKLGRFDEVRPQAEVVNGGVVLTFNVVERQRIESVEFRGVRSVKLADVEREAGLSVGGYVDPSKLALAREAVQRLYRGQGYYFAEVALEQEPLRRGQVIFNIREGPKVRVRSIQFKGNDILPAADLQKQIETKKYMLIFSAGILDEQAVKGDVTRLLQYYRDEGFLDAQVGYTIQSTPDQKWATVTFLISEGPRYRVGAVRFEGNTVFQAAELRGVMLLQPDAVYKADCQRHDIKAIEDELYGRQGYVNAAVEILPRFAEERGVVNLIVRVREGQRVFVGRTDIVGNEVTHDKVIRRNISLEPTEPFNVVEAQASRERLKSLQLFDKVEITPAAAGPDDTRDVLVMVEEARTTNFVVGVGISSDAGLLGNVTIENRNFDLFGWPKQFGQLFTGRAFKGAGQTLRVVAEPGTEINRFQVQFYEPYFLDKELSLGSNLFFFTRQREAYDETRVGYVLSFGQRFRKFWSLEESVRVEMVDISNVDNDAPSDITDVEGSNFIIGGKVAIARDTTDNRFLPTEGSRLSLSVEPVGGTSTFARLYGSYHAYHTVRTDVYDRKSVLSGRVDIGYIAGDAPVFERFYAGGISTIRGFKFRGVGPVAGPDDDPVGGNFLFLAGTEYAIPLWGESQLVFFIDTGTVEKTATITSYRASVGAEVRIPIKLLGSVPLTIGVGVPVAKESTDEDQIFHFLFGTSF